MADKLGAWDWLGEKYFQYFGLDPDVHDPDYFNNSSPSKIAPINDNPFGLKDYDEIPYETIRSDSDYDESNLLPPSHGMYNE
jgi:hypothetical protein